MEKPLSLSYMFDKSKLRNYVVENELRCSLKTYSLEVFRIPNRHNQKIISPGHITVKMSRIQSKGTILNARR